ncbi:MAG: hypothetical protein JWM16_4883 [Verrucomicrobiales bacterium]|nr:hypothetical protein [Verrucomicrobiales bacterium]
MARKPRVQYPDVILPCHERNHSSEGKQVKVTLCRADPLMLFALT